MNISNKTLQHLVNKENSYKKRIISSDVIKKMRKKQGLTQQELADKIGVSQKDVSRWENGKREPSITTLNKIADALDLNISIRFF
jgi:transcriptional regulator with XRE-family HTH domain